MTRAAVRLVAVCLGVAALFAPPAASAQIVVDTALDVADPPFDADGTCGVGTIDDLPGADGLISLREAIIAANNTPGPQTIEFAEALRGMTINVGFDDADADEAPDQLPILCGGGTSIDGDIDGDDAPDIEIHGNDLFPPLTNAVILFSSGNRVNGLRITGYEVGLTVVHIAAFTPAPSSAENRLTHNVVEGAVSCIVVEAGAFDNATQAGVVDQTVIADNTVTGCSANGIFAFTGDAPASSITNTVIERNHVVDGDQFGIIIQANLSAFGSATLIGNTVVRDNDVIGNAVTGITAFSYAGQQNHIDEIEIRGNRATDNGTAIAITGGSCGARDNFMDASVLDNEVNSTLAALGGSDFSCPGSPLPATGNRNRAVIAGNRIAVLSALPGLSLLGGYERANGNTLEAQVEDNRVSGLSGIAIVGGQGGPPGTGRGADDNTADVEVKGNATGNGGSGISISAGGSGDADENTALVQIVENTSCNGILNDVQCYGGLPALPGYPANQGSGNRVTGTIAANQATVIVSSDGVAGNQCAAEVEENTPCTPGDVNCDRVITAADVLAQLAVDTTGVPSVCGLDSDVPTIVSAVFVL